MAQSVANKRVYASDPVPQSNLFRLGYPGPAPFGFPAAHVRVGVLIAVAKHLGARGHVRRECSCPGPRGSESHGCKNDTTLLQIAAWRDN